MGTQTHALRQVREGPPGGGEQCAEMEKRKKPQLGRVKGSGYYRHREQQMQRAEGERRCELSRELPVT